MASDDLARRPVFGFLLALALLTGCGMSREKTAPCKRPAELTPYAHDPRQSCGPMQNVNDPASAFAAIGLK
jgi:hypothetical protein